MGRKTGGFTWPSLLREGHVKPREREGHVTWLLEALNLHTVSVVHFALIDANWRISSISRGFGLLGFCLPRLLDSRTSATSRTFWIYRTVSASLLNLCWHRYCNVRLLSEHQVRLFHFLNWTKTFSAGIFAVIKPRGATTSHSSCLRTCKLFMPQRG